MKNTAPSSYTDAKEAQNTIQRFLANSRDTNELKAAIVAFEDAMNGLSGDILNLDDTQQSEIQLENKSIVENVVAKGLEINIHDSVLPKEDREVTEFDVTTLLGKRIYPRTESVQILTAHTSTETPTESNTTTTTTDTIVLSDEEEVDEIFNEIDAEAAGQVEAPLSTQQNETVPYLSTGMINLALTAAANSNGLQSGLTTFSHNPLADLIDNTKQLLLYYTANNYTNLNSALSGVATDPTLATEYKKLQNAIGGNDGLSGCISQLDNFKDHTDRLAGLVLDESSPNAEPTDDSKEDFLTLNDFSGGPTLIFSFNARKFRSAKYLIQASSDQTDRGHQATEIYILHDNYHAYTREVTSIYTQEPFVTYTTRLLNNNVEVYATSNVSNTNFVISGTRLQIAKASKSYAAMSQQAIIKLHELMSVYLDDGVDYVQLCSESLLKPYLVANLGREFQDMLDTISSGYFLSQSTSTKQAGLLQWASIIQQRHTDIQTQMDTDWNNFVSIRRKTESFDIAFNLTVAHTDESGNAIPKATLNNATIQAIESVEE